MSIRKISKSSQAYGAFNGGQIVENKPIGFPQDGGFVRPYSNLFYWARAKGVIDSTIGLHPHQGFEIMSFVLEGKIRHYDTKMDAWKELEAGSAQIIRAGNGIQHAEHIYKDGVIFQIWVDPDLSKTLSKEASYNDYSIDELEIESVHGGEVIHYTGEKGPMELDSEGVVIQEWKTNESFHIDLENQILSAYVIGGSGKMNDETLETDDFIIVEEMELVTITPDRNGMRLFVFKTPAKLSYQTYAELMRSKSQLA